MTSSRRILVTTALPYANGDIHLGHLLEYIQADIWVRQQRLLGHEIFFLCADDAHGTPIMLRARNEGITPEALIERIGHEHRDDMAAFAISFDNYHSTHSPENQKLAIEFYTALQSGGHIARRTIQQAYDPEEGIFLPDRFIRGNCPRCAAPDQYGDSCEVCSATYDAQELDKPYSVLSGATPETRESEHYFFKLPHFSRMLEDWLHSGRLQEEVVNKLQEWFVDGLKEWDISRDAPYFGFEIPDAPGKYFYVWLDAPIGYFASFRHFCQERDMDANAILKAKDTEIYHFIGKDILYFHGLFWPAMLHGAGYSLPTNLFVHGFLTVNGRKMSKSRGTFISAKEYLAHFEPDYLRYYFAAKLTARVEDFDLNLEDFVARINADLVGKFINIASRTSGFIDKQFSGKLADSLADPTMYAAFADAGEAISAAWTGRRYSHAIREIMLLADQANQYINQEQPWLLAKDSNQHKKLHQVCTQGINLFRLLALYLAPVMPNLMQKIEALLQQPIQIAGNFGERHSPLLNHSIKPFKHLLKRLDEKQIARMIESAKSDETHSNEFEALASEIQIEDFAAIDLRIARIIKAERVPESTKLLKLRVDLGFCQRTIFAGIQGFYEPADLEGRLTVVVANLKPRKMRFGESQGMVLAAAKGEGLWLLNPDSGALPGARIS